MKRSMIGTVRKAVKKPGDSEKTGRPRPSKVPPPAMPKQDSSPPPEQS